VRRCEIEFSVRLVGPRPADLRARPPSAENKNHVVWKNPFRKDHIAERYVGFPQDMVSREGPGLGCRESVTFYNTHVGR